MTMKDLDFVCLLKKANPDSEVWWDTSPTQYATFRGHLAARYPRAQGYIERLLPERFDAGECGISGATTNPRLVTSAILDESLLWLPRIQALRLDHSAEQVGQIIYAELIGKGAGLLQDLWCQTVRRQGWLSAQVDASDVHCADAMEQQGLALARTAPNLMIKVPGSEAGYVAIERLVAQGCSINTTFCFSVSQVAAGIAAIRRGQRTAIRNRIDLSGTRHVITFMMGRWGAEAALDQQANQRGMRLAPSDKRWAEVAIYQTIQSLMKRVESPARLLISSIKIDTAADGTRHCWHLEKTGEHTTCYTLTPEVIEFMVQRAAERKPLKLDLESAVPFDVLNRLMQLPYFRDACSEDAIAAQDFARHPAFIRVRHEACMAQQRLIDFIQTVCLSASTNVSRPDNVSAVYWGTWV
ncbi:MAG: Transaldolase [Pseudomonas sp.]|nr:Transaldolase [Pseudomonas sp.]